MIANLKEPLRDLGVGMVASIIALTLWLLFDLLTGGSVVATALEAAKLFAFSAPAGMLAAKLGRTL